MSIAKLWEQVEKEIVGVRRSEAQSIHRFLDRIELDENGDMLIWTDGKQGGYKLFWVANIRFWASKEEKMLRTILRAIRHCHSRNSDHKTHNLVRRANIRLGL